MKAAKKKKQPLKRKKPVSTGSGLKKIASAKMHEAQDPERRMTDEEAEEAAWTPVYSKYSDEEG
jgi:hypothetical protein